MTKPQYITLWVWIFWMWAAVLTSAEAASRYVVATGGLSTGTCTTTGTACTRTQAQNQAVSGDEVVFRDGNYTSWTEFNLTTAGITYRAENRRQAVIYPTAQGWTIQASNITIRGFRVEGNFLGDSCIRVQSTPQLTNLVIEDNHCHEIGKIGLFIQNTDGLIVRFNDFDSMGWNTDLDADPGEAIYFGTIVSGAVVTNCEVYGNRIAQGSAQAIDVKASANCDIHHNIIENWGLQAGQTTNDSTQGALSFEGAFSSPANNFSNNIMRNSPNMAAASNAFTAVMGSQRNTTMNNNVLYDWPTPNALFVGVGAGNTLNAQNNTWCNTSSSTNLQSGSVNTTGSLYNQAQSVCDAEVSRILNEQSALPGNPTPSSRNRAVTIS